MVISSIKERHVSKVKRFAYILLTAVSLSSQGLAADELDVNVGYSKKNPSGPVPIQPECLIPQALSDTTTTIYAGAAVSPTIAVNPRNINQIVTIWQQNRISNSGSQEAGIGYSKNGGRSWHHTLIPFQKCIGGFVQRVSNVWLSYAPDGKRVYLTAVAVNATTDPNTENQEGIVASVSEDGGKSWSNPQFVGSSTFPLDIIGPFYDKVAVTADRNHRHVAYIVWDFLPDGIFRAVTQLSRTVNGGVTWQPNRTIYDPFPDLVAQGLSNDNPNDAATVNNIVVVLPEANPQSKVWKKDKYGDDANKSLRFSGDVLNFMSRTYAAPGATDEEYLDEQNNFTLYPRQFSLYDFAYVRSSDLGETWNANAQVITSNPAAPVFTGGYSYNELGQVTGGVGTLMRTGSFIPSYNVNPKNGFLYIVYQTPQFRADQLSQIGLMTSRDGGYTWSSAAQVNRTPADSANPQAFTPFVAITRNGYVGVLYFDFRKDDKSDPNATKTDAWLAIYREVKDSTGGSTGIGLDFVKEVRLSQKSYIAQNGPTTAQGVMTDGDYCFLVAEGNRFYAAYTKTHKGPFTPAVPIFVDPTRNATLLLDNNYRQSPYVSIVTP